MAKNKIELIDCFERKVVVTNQIVVTSFNKVFTLNCPLLYLEETMKSTQHVFYANTFISSHVLCPKHYISMYVVDYLAKL